MHHLPKSLNWKNKEQQKDEAERTVEHGDNDAGDNSNEAKN